MVRPETVKVKKEMPYTVRSGRVEKRKARLQNWYLTPSPPSLLPLHPNTPLTRNRDCQSVVTLLTGPKGTPLIVHKAIACKHSPVFRAAFNSEFREGQEQMYELEDRSEDTIRVLIKWLYSQELDLKQVQLRLEQPRPNAASKKARERAMAIKGREDLILCELWVCTLLRANLVFYFASGVAVPRGTVSLHVRQYFNSLP